MPLRIVGLNNHARKFIEGLEQLPDYVAPQPEGGITKHRRFYCRKENIFYSEIPQFLEHYGEDSYLFTHLALSYPNPPNAELENGLAFESIYSDIYWGTYFSWSFDPRLGIGEYSYEDGLTWQVSLDPWFSGLEKILRDVTLTAPRPIQ